MNRLGFNSFRFIQVTGKEREMRLILLIALIVFFPMTSTVDNFFRQDLKQDNDLEWKNNFRKPESLELNILNALH
jgi:hypothetical protein